MNGAAEVEAYAAGGELVDDVAGVGYGPGEPVEPVDHEGVAGPAGGQGFAEPWPGPVGAADAVVDVDPVGLHAELGEGLALRAVRSCPSVGTRA